MKETFKELFRLFDTLSLSKKGALLLVFVALLLFCFFFFPKKGENREEPRAPEESEKGFALFDNATWIKGEKELQILEMRALKGQLEADLAAFDAIDEARVILDLAGKKTLRGAATAASASVIITKKPNTYLTKSQLAAISYHLAGAVRGLKVSRIAISDTTGKLYKTAIEEGVTPFFEPEETLNQEIVTAKIGHMLQRVVGEKGATYTISEGEEGLQVGVILDANRVQEVTVKGLEQQLQTFLKGYAPFSLTVQCLPFAAKTSHLEEDTSSSTLFLYVVSFLVVFSLFFTLALILKRKKTVKKEESPPFPVTTTTVNLDDLAHSLNIQDPEAIAAMLAMLPKERGEFLLSRLPEGNQIEVLKALSEIEKKER